MLASTVGNTGGSFYLSLLLDDFLDMIITIAIKYNSLKYFIKLNYQPLRLRPNPCFMRNPLYTFYHLLFAMFVPPYFPTVECIANMGPCAVCLSTLPSSSLSLYKNKISLSLLFYTFLSSCMPISKD